MLLIFFKYQEHCLNLNMHMKNIESAGGGSKS